MQILLSGKDALEYIDLLISKVEKDLRFESSLKKREALLREKVKHLETYIQLMKSV